MLHHRSTSLAAFAAAGMILAVASFAVAAEAQRPNILFIMSDDHAYQALSCYDGRLNQTPNLDRLAREGMRFENCFVTNSICGPCRAVILTGKYSHLNGFIRNGNRFNGEQQTVAKLLKQAGYQTAVCGKWHLGSDPTGFDYWHVLQGQGPYYNPPMKTPEGTIKHIGYTTDIITDQALHFLKNEAFEQANLEGDDLVHWKYQRYIKDYLRCVASVDDNVGRVLDYLDETGLAENTIVIYTSDQSFYLGEHGWFDKRFMYEESHRTPLMVRWPGKIEPGSRCDALTLNLDFAETMLDAAGVAVPDDMQGESLVPLLAGEKPADWRESVYYRYYEFPGAHSVRRHYGVRTDRYKLIYFNRIDEWELYDLEKDPQEMESVCDDPAYADIVAELKTELDRLRKLYGDDDTIRGEPLKAPQPRKRG